MAITDQNQTFPPDWLPPVTEPVGSAPGLIDAEPKIDGYRITCRLGEGGMGTVWRAVQLSTRREVALKLIRAAGLASERSRQRFDREVELTARLEHPNIARIYDSGVHYAVYFYAMELIIGDPLDVYAEAQFLGPRQKLELMRTICRAVEHAHQRGVIHRDLKPCNILVTPDGQPHVLDFGLAKAMAADSKSELSLEGDLAGTPAYMSPEQASGCTNVDTRSDVYSLAVILFRLMTGHTPHDLSGSREQLLRRISNEEVRRPRDLDPVIDRDLEAILLKALAKDPEARYASAGALAQDLDNYLAGDPVTAKLPTLAYFVAKRLRKNRAWASVAVATLAAFASVIVYDGWRITHQRDRAIEAEGNARRAQRIAEVQVGEGLLLQADALAEGGLWLEAAPWYRRAYAALDRLEEPTRDVDLGIWNLNRIAAPPVAVWTGHTNKVLALAFCADGRRVVSGGLDGVLELRDAPTGKVLRTMQLPTPPCSIAVLPDDRHVAFSGLDGSLRMWDLKTGAESKCFVDSGRSASVTLSPDGVRIACGGVDGSVGVWNVADGRMVRTVRGHAKAVTSAAFCPDGHRIVSVSFDNTIRIWDLDAEEPLLRTIGDQGIGFIRVCCSPDGKHFAVGGWDHLVWVYDLEPSPSSQRSSGDLTTSNQKDAIPARIFGNHALRITGLNFSPDSRYLVSASADTTLKLWDVQLGKEVRLFRGHGELVADASFSPDGRSLVSAGWDKSIRLWSIEDGPELQTIKAHALQVCTACFSPDCRLLASGGWDGWIKLWDVPTGRNIKTFRVKDGGIPGTGIATGLWFTPDGARIVSGGWDHVVRVWGVQSGQELKTLGRHDGRVTSVALSPDGRSVVSAGEEGTVKLWDLDGTRQQRTLYRGREALYRIVFVSKQKVLISRADGVFVLLDTEGNQPPHSFTKHSSTGSVRGDLRNEVSGTVSPDGKLIAAAGMDNTLALWDVSSEREVADLGGHDAGVFDAAFFPDGSLVMSTGDDGLLKLWDVNTHRRLRTFTGLHHDCVNITFSVGANLAVSGCTDGTMLLLDFDAPARDRMSEPGLLHARELLASNGDDAAALAVIGSWYANHGIDVWAVPCLEQARRSGVNIPALLLARCYWRLNRLADAAREFQRASDQKEAPQLYLGLCIQAVQESQRHP